MARRRKTRRPKEKATEQVVRISELGWHGDGVGDVDGKRVFVPFTLAGEEVRAMVSGTRGQLLEILESAPERVEPSCPYFAQCGGCAVQHLDTESYADWKRQVIVRALQNRDVDAPVAPLLDAHGEGRRRVTLHVRFSPEAIHVGFMQGHSHKLIDIDSCPILCGELAQATKIARALAEPFVSKPKPLDIQLTASETGLDCDIRGCGELDLDARMDLSDCAIKHDLARVTVDRDMVLERRPPVLTFATAKVTLPPAGFLQATKAGEDALSSLVSEAIGDVKKVVDLYCGIGPFALRLASRCSVMAYDSDEEAFNALNFAAHHTQGLKPVTAHMRDLIHNPLHVEELKDFDAVVFDPPRAGAEAQAIELAQSKIGTVVAVSCNPATFAHDAAILIDGGYRLEQVTPVDQFRYAGHVELVSVFRRS